MLISIWASVVYVWATIYKIFNVGEAGIRRTSGGRRFDPKKRISCDALDITRGLKYICGVCAGCIWDASYDVA